MAIENEKRSKDALMPQRSHHTNACSGKLMRFLWRQLRDSSVADDTKLLHISSPVSWVFSFAYLFPSSTKV